MQPRPTHPELCSCSHYCSDMRKLLNRLLGRSDDDGRASAPAASAGKKVVIVKKGVARDGVPPPPPKPSGIGKKEFGGLKKQFEEEKSPEPPVKASPAPAAKKIPPPPAKPKDAKAAAAAVRAGYAVESKEEVKEEPKPKAAAAAVFEKPKPKVEEPKPKSAPAIKAGVAAWESKTAEATSPVPKKKVDASPTPAPKKLADKTSGSSAGAPTPEFKKKEIKTKVSGSEGTKSLLTGSIKGAPPRDSRSIRGDSEASKAAAAAALAAAKEGVDDSTGIAPGSSKIAMLGKLLEKKTEEKAEQVSSLAGIEPVLEELALKSESLKKFKFSGNAFFSQFRGKDPIREKNSKALAEAIASHPYITHIEAYSSSLDDAFAIAFADCLKAGKMKQLESIHFESNMFTGDGLQAIMSVFVIVDNCPNIKVIKLANQGNMSTAAEQTAIEALTKNTNITTLSFDFRRPMDLADVNRLLARNGTMRKKVRSTPSATSISSISVGSAEKDTSALAIRDSDSEIPRIDSTGSGTDFTSSLKVPKVSKPRLSMDSIDEKDSGKKPEKALSSTSLSSSMKDDEAKAAASKFAAAAGPSVSGLRSSFSGAPVPASPVSRGSFSSGSTVSSPGGTKKKTGREALLEWCRQLTSGYPGLPEDGVSNFSADFRSGLAFAAIIHRFRPELINFAALRQDKTEEAYVENLQKAFKAGEDAGIASFLEVNDVAKFAAPDNKIIFTQITEYYQVFKTQVPSGEPPASGASAEPRKIPPPPKRGSVSAEPAPVKRSKFESAPVLGKAEVKTVATGNMLCPRCNEPIIESEGGFVEIGDGKLHEKCFNCWECGKKFRTLKGVVPVGGALYCDMCGRKAFIKMTLATGGKATG